MTTWRSSVLYALLAAFIGVASWIPISGFLRGWDQLSQLQFWVEKASGFAGGFVGFVLVLALFRARRRGCLEPWQVEPEHPQAGRAHRPGE